MGSDKSKQMEIETVDLDENKNLIKNNVIHQDSNEFKGRVTTPIGGRRTSSLTIAQREDMEKSRRKSKITKTTDFEE